MRTIDDYADEVRGEAEKRKLPQLFQTKKPLAFNIKRHAYSRGCSQTQDGQSMISRDKKYLEAHKFQVLKEFDVPNFNFNVNSLEYKKPNALPENMLHQFG